MKAAVYSFSDFKEVGKVDLNETVFGEEYRADILSRVVHWQQAKARSGCHKTMHRGEVSGSTRKIYKQKGTGQARHGSIKAPIFVGGGIVFGPVVRDHGYKLNKKIVNLGLKVALSLKQKQNSFIVLDQAESKTAKTSELKSKLQTLEAKSVLIIDSEININTKLSCGNLHNINVLPTKGLNVVDILKHEKVAVTKAALKEIEERLAC
ncbi:MAG: 50S ribosomal protein L4 [Rickettsiales bacterium]